MLLIGGRAELGRPKDRQGVFLTVHGAARERRHRIRPAHLSRVGPQGGEGLQEQGGAHDADLQALQIIRNAHGFLRIAQLAKPVFPPGQGHHVLFRENLEKLLADLPARQSVHGLVVGHQKRHGEQVQLHDLRRPVDGRANGQIDGPLADGGKFLGLVPAHEARTGIHFDMDAACGLFPDQLHPSLPGIAPGKRLSQHRGKLVFLLVVRRDRTLRQD